MLCPPSSPSSQSLARSRSVKQSVTLESIDSLTLAYPSGEEEEEEEEEREKTRNVEMYGVFVDAERGVEKRSSGMCD